MSRILKRFEKNGLIERKISETDKRVHYVSLTEEGKKELAEINYRADKQVAGVIQYLNDEEKERLRNAAKELNISQQGLSHAIHSLEKDYGLPLFEKTGRNVRLSPYGLEIKKYIEDYYITRKFD